MKQKQFIAGIVSLALAAILFLINMNKYAFLAGRTSVIIYPAGFLALVSGILILKSLLQQKPS